MSNEIHINVAAGKNIYAVRYNSAGQVALTNGSAFENWGTAGRDADDYDVTLAVVGTGGTDYIGDFDASSNIAAGDYAVVVYERAGASPVNGDNILGSNVMYWDGAAEVTVRVVDTVTDFLKDIAEGNEKLTVATGRYTIKNKTTDATLIDKQTKDKNGTDISAVTTVIAETAEPV